MKQQPKTKTMTFYVPRDQSYAKLLAGMALPGYAFTSMERKGTKAVVTFTRKRMDA